jgi:tellurite resistance protein TerC
LFGSTSQASDSVNFPCRRSVHQRITLLIGLSIQNFRGMAPPLFCNRQWLFATREEMPLFPFSEFWWFYLGFAALVVLLLVIDLGVFHRKPHAISFREAALWSLIWVAFALAFNYFFYRWAQWQLAGDGQLSALGLTPARAARQAALEFFAGYLVEWSLSVDNIFVFVLVFRYFAIPPQYQHRILFFGILGAILFRAGFIALGAALLHYRWVMILFGLFLIFTGVKMFLAPDKKIEPERNPLIRLFRKFVPITPQVDGPRFLVRRNGVWHGTPLLITLLFVEATDILFAVDSVPAIFALTREPLIVFTSNACAILGLRSLYFLLAGAVEKFYLLKYGLALVLMFVGLKMAWLNEAFGGKFPIELSLGIISLLIGTSIGASLVVKRRPETAGAAESSAD